MFVLAIGQGLLWSILGLGIFMTYRILNFPDMTTEGTFPLGGAVCIAAITNGISPIIATLLGVLAGMVAGFVTGILYTKGKIPIILAGILVMSALNSVILFVMQSPNLVLRKEPRLTDYLAFLHLPKYFDTVILGLVVVSLIIGALVFFLYTNLGQAYIATGDNEEMARSLGIMTDKMKIIGLTISNGVIALSGALISQNDGYANVNKGIGVIVIGLSSIIIGEIIFGELSLSERLVATVIGSIFYQLLVSLVIKLGFDTTYLKIFTSTLLAICLMVPQLKEKLDLHFFEKEKR